MTSERGLVVTKATLRVPIALCALGAIGFIVGLIVATDRTWLNLLIDGFFVLSLGVSCLFFFGSQRLANSLWAVPTRRIYEAYSLVLPAGALMLAILAFGFHAIYQWTSPDKLWEHNAPVHGGREVWLIPWFVYIRMIVVAVVWIFFAYRIRKVSLASDKSREAGVRGFSVLQRYAGIFTIVFVFTFVAAAYDWIISLNPKWFSTMFSVYVFAGTNVQGIAAIALAIVILKKKKLLGAADSVFNGDLIQTLGTMMLAFSTFWGYIWVCQFLLIWYGNIPEEATYYLQRYSHGWLPVFLAGFAISWIIPFFTLLPRSSKRSLKMMIAMSVLILVGRWLDIFIMVMPSHSDSPPFGPLEIAMAAGTVGLIWIIFVRGLSRAPIVSPHDPVLEFRSGHGHASGGAS